MTLTVLLVGAIAVVGYFKYLARPPASQFAERMLRLIRAPKSRPSGTWSDDDYDVFDGGQYVGRIVWSYAAPHGRPWVWSITCRFPQAPGDRGAAASRAQWQSSKQDGDPDPP